MEIHKELPLMQGSLFDLGGPAAGDAVDAAARRAASRGLAGDLSAFALAIAAVFERGESIATPTELYRRAAAFFGASRASGAYTSRDVFDALECGVNYYVRATAVRLLSRGAAELLAFAGRTLARVPVQRDRTTEQVLFQQFSTPPTLGLLAAVALRPASGDVVMEPSAGTGSLAVWAEAFGASVVVNEIAERRRALLEVLGYRALAVDAELLDDLLPAEIAPTHVLMNPPFSATGGRLRTNRAVFGASHVEQALRRLAPGGRLVAIVGEGLGAYGASTQRWWRYVAGRYRLVANIALPKRAYERYGTTYRVHLVVFDKPAGSPALRLEPRPERFGYLEPPTLEDALALVLALPPREGAHAPGAPEVRARVPLRAPALEPAAAPGPSAETELPPEGPYVRYVPRRFAGARPHPADLVETIAMASISTPEPTYTPALPPEVLAEGRISDVQFERVVYAGQRHSMTIGNGARAGFLLGDGTGVGKGRTIAAIILDNALQGRGRACWLSASNTLSQDAAREIAALGADVPLWQINDVDADGSLPDRDGVTFCTYASLIARAKSGRRRLDQLAEWLGSDPVIVVDESHRGKNAVGGGEREGTQTGAALIELQDRIPGARVVYSSATAATEVRNLAYCVRLGLWGPGTPFLGFEEFMAEVSEGGIAALELVSRDLKAFGGMLAAQISFAGVRHREVTHVLTPEQREMYDTAARAWQLVLRNFEEALDITNGGGRARGLARQNFWSAKLRFAKALTTALKLPTALREMERALAEGKSCVVSLVGTGEARARTIVARALADGSDLDALNFAPDEILKHLVREAYPTVLHRDEVSDAGDVRKVVVTDSEGRPVHSAEALRRRDALLDELDSLVLPENPLDSIVNHFGARNVAEITGRVKRLVRLPGGRVEYRKRVDGVPAARINEHEMRQFQSGAKRVAVISNAGSVGVSLHASRDVANQDPRVFFTLEVGWSADVELQRLGRVHRSNQAHPPEYCFVTTELGGERRFCSTIARRLESLGAITRGQRDAASAGDIGHFNFETEYGAAALERVCTELEAGAAPPGLGDPILALRDMGLLEDECAEKPRVADASRDDVSRFLNRIFALEVERQQAIYGFFFEVYDDVLRKAQESGEYDSGLVDISGLDVTIAEPPVVVYTDEVTRAETKHYTLTVREETHPIAFDEMEARRRVGLPDVRLPGAYFVNRRSGGVVCALPSRSDTDADGKVTRAYKLFRPSGTGTTFVSGAALSKKFAPLTSPDAAGLWRKAVEADPGYRERRVHMLVGAILPLWKTLRAAIDDRLEIVRVEPSNGPRLVGVRIPTSLVRTVLHMLGIAGVRREPAEILDAVATAGDTVELVTGIKVRRTRLAGEYAVEVTGAKPADYRRLREIGLRNEEIAFRQRFFIPTDPAIGVPVLERLLKQFPAVS